jgi:hypothetical protein
MRNPIRDGYLVTGGLGNLGRTSKLTALPGARNNKNTLTYEPRKRTYYTQRPGS